MKAKITTKYVAFFYITILFAINFITYQNFITFDKTELSKDTNSFDEIHQAVSASNVEVEDQQEEFIKAQKELEEKEVKDKNLSLLRAPATKK